MEVPLFKLPWSDQGASLNLPMVIVSTFYPRNKFPSTTDAEALWTVELAWHQIFFNEGSAFSCIESISFRWEIMSDCFRNGRTYLFPFRNLINLGHAWASAEFFKDSHFPASGWPSAGDKQCLTPIPHGCCHIVLLISEIVRGLQWRVYWG